MKGYYKLKKIKVDTGELVLETDWISNIITEFFLESRGNLNSSEVISVNISGTSGPKYDGDSGYVGTADTNGWTISDKLRFGELVSLFANGFITITDESLVEGYGEIAQLNATNPNTSIRMGKVISGVPEISNGLIWDDVNQNFYMSLTQQFAPPPSLYTVRTLCLAPNRNYGFEGDFWLYGDGVNDNRTWTYTNIKNLSGITPNFPLYSYTTLSPEVTQDPTETLIVSYKIVFEPPAAGGITKSDWISVISTMAGGNRYYGVNNTFPGTVAEDTWLGGWPTPLELVGPASTTPLTGNQYNIWRRHFDDYDGYSRQSPGQSTNYNYDAIYHTNYISYTKNLTDSDLGRIRGAISVGNTNYMTRSWSHLWYNLLPEGSNQTQNYYAHSATKDKPFFEATNIANTTGTLSIDSSSLSQKSLPELWRVNYGTTGIVGASSYNVLTRKLTGTNNNSYDYRSENLFHPGFFQDSYNSSNLYQSGNYGGLDQFAAPYDRMIDRLGNPNDVALYSRFYEVTLSDGRPAMLQFYCRTDLQHSFITVYDPQTPEVIEIVDNGTYPSYNVIQGADVIYDDISGDYYVFCQINGVFRIQNLLNVGTGVVVTNFNSWSTTFEGATVQNTITNPNPALDDFFGAKVSSNQTYTVVSNDTINGSGSSGYVYVYNNSTGALTYTLQDPTSPSTNTAFGFSISISPKNNVLVVGAPNKTTGSGVVYVYDLDSSPLTPQSTITNQNVIGTPDNDNFGYSVAVMSDGTYDFLVVGAPGEDSALNTQNGTAYVYDLQNLITPVLTYTIANPDNTTANDDKFGTVVAINDNNKVIIGSPNEPNSLNQGAVYVYNSPSGNFNDLSNTATLTNPSGSPAGDYFGYSLAVSTNYLYVGSPFDGEGKVYKYTLSNNSLAATFQAPTPQAGGEFGKSIAVDFSENRYIIGEPGEQKAYVYLVLDDSLEETITNPGATSPSTDRFSDSVAIQPNVVSIGVPGEDGASNQQGALYLYQPGVTGLTDVAVNPVNRTYALTLGKPISGTHRTLWGIVEGALVKSIDQGATWEGYDSTSTGGVTFTNSVVENLWGRVVVFKCDPNDDKLFIVATNNTGAQAVGSYGAYFDTFAYWWDPVSDTTSIGEIFIQAYNGRSHIISKSTASSNYHWAINDYGQFYPEVVTFWNKYFGCTSEGLWWGTNSRLTAFTFFSTNTGDPWARPWTASYGDLTLTHMTNAGNTSRTGLEYPGDSFNQFDNETRSYTLGPYYTSNAISYDYGRMWEEPIEFTRIDGVKGLIKAERWSDNNNSNADIYFFPFDNVTYTDEAIMDGSTKAGNGGYLWDYFIWRGTLISTREDSWRIESIGDPAQTYGVPSLYRRWLWEEYIWNSGNTSWDLASPSDSVTYKTTHATTDSFIKGSTVSFDDALNSQIFTASEYHTTGILSGVWNDNNEEWSFSADTNSIYPSKGLSGTTPSTLSLGNNSTPVRVFLSTTVNDGYEGTGAEACRAGDPTNSGTYDNVAELTTDYWRGGLTSTTTGGSGSSSYQSYVEIRQKEYNPLYGSGFTFKPYVNSSSSSVVQTISGGFRPASTTLLYSDGDAEAIYNYSMYPQISNIMVPGQSNSGACYNELTFGLTEQTFSGGTFPTGNNSVTYAFRLRWNDNSHTTQLTRNAPYEWTLNKFIIEIIESGIVVNTVSTDEYCPNYLGSYGNYDYLRSSSKSTLENNLPITNWDFPDSSWAATGITFKVKKESTAIKYYLNNTLVYTSLSTSSNPVAPANFFTSVGHTGTNNAITSQEAHGTLVLQYKLVKQDYWVRLGTSGNVDGSFDPNLLVIAGRLKESLGVTLNGTPVTWVADGYIGTLNAGECSLFPNDGYLRFSAADSGKAVAISNNVRYLIRP